MTPTQRSKKHLEKLGYTVAIVERWNAWAKIRQDLFGIADLLAVGPAGTLAVQTTTYEHRLERRVKVLACPHLDALMAAKWSVVVHGWKRPNKGTPRWTLVTVDIVTLGAMVQIES